MMAADRPRTADDHRVVGVSRRLFDAWEKFSCTRWAIALMFCWAFAEAIVWPIIPDFLLVLLAIGNRRRFWVPLAAAIAGSAMGGTLLYLFAYWSSDQAADFLRALPLVSDAQIAEASREIGDEGVSAFWWQPWSGVPFKVWGLVAGADGLAPWQAIPVFVTTRAFRMALFAALIALVGWRIPGFVRNYALLIVVLYLVIFSVFWWQTQVAA